MKNGCQALVVLYLLTGLMAAVLGFLWIFGHPGYNSATYWVILSLSVVKIFRFNFQNIHISEENIHYCASMDSMISSPFHNCCISNGKYTFWCVDGFAIFDHISLLLHVLANIQYFGADLRTS